MRPGGADAAGRLGCGRAARARPGGADAAQGRRTAATAAPPTAAATPVPAGAAAGPSVPCRVPYWK